jgi:8-oxo-dGTP pyrophosphatase MutT (NUDIX family)
LYEDVVEVLGGWVPPDEAQAQVRQRFLELLGSAPAAVAAGHPGAHLTASVLVVRADLGQVLLCLHGRIRRWVQLGGHLEPVDASLADAALREATEESGITGIRIDPVPIHLDVHPVQCRAGASQHYDVRFAALAPPGAVPVVSDESLELGWFPPDALPEPLASATAPLIPLALARLAAWVTPGARSAP